jgi:hypothetical protein
MGPPSYMRSDIDRNVVMRRIPVFLSKDGDTGFQSLTYTSLWSLEHYYVRTRIFGLSQRYGWGLSSSGIWRRVMGNRFLAFRRDILPSSCYSVIDSRLFETTLGLRNTGIHHTTRRHIPKQHSPQSVRSFSFISFCKFNTPLQRRHRRLQRLLRLNIISITDPAIWTPNHMAFTMQDYPLISNIPTSCGPCEILCTQSIKIAKKLKLSNGGQAFNKHTS